MKKFIYIFIILFAVGAVVYYFGQNTAPEVKHEASAKPVRALQRKALKLPKLSLPKLEYKMPLSDNLDEITQQVVGLDSSISTAQRNKIVWKLKNRILREEDFRAFYTFLKTSPTEDGAHLTLHSLKNDLLIFVIEDGRYKESTAQLMIDIINDSGQHEVMREYTLQYVTDFFERHWVNNSPARDLELKGLSTIDKQLQDAFVKTMWNMLDSAEGPIAGTALIRLDDLSKYLPSINQIKIDQETSRMISDSLVPPSSRMAALSVAANRKMDHLINQVSDIAFDDSGSISLRMAALHTASTLNPEKGFIDKLSKEILNNPNANKLLKRAAELAIKKLQKIRG